MDCVSNCVVYVVDRKYEEITPPHVEELCYITDNTYTKEDVSFMFHFVILGSVYISFAVL